MPFNRSRHLARFRCAVDLRRAFESTTFPRGVPARWMTFESSEKGKKKKKKTLQRGERILDRWKIRFETAFNLPAKQNAPSRRERGLSPRLHESINKHRRLPVSTTSGWHISIVLPLRINAKKVEREREREPRDFGTKKPSIPGSNELSSRSHPPPPVLSTLRHSIFHYFPIVRLVPLVPSISISLL